MQEVKFLRYKVMQTLCAFRRGSFQAKIAQAVSASLLKKAGVQRSYFSCLLYDGSECSCQMPPEKRRCGFVLNRSFSSHFLFNSFIRELNCPLDAVSAPLSPPSGLLVPVQTHSCMERLQYSMCRGVPFLLNCTTVQTSTSRHSAKTQGMTIAMAFTVLASFSSSMITSELPSSTGCRSGTTGVNSQPIKSFRIERG